MNDCTVHTVCPYHSSTTIALLSNSREDKVSGEENGIGAKCYCQDVTNHTDLHLLSNTMWDGSNFSTL